ncbi:hypothetical protein AVEN_79830-1 [Araneus ventricosus]|uniref:Uncharacterized protein n=1 Tax=Araneus ventricosus TaxID=182803 RepID=A0A4Y2F0T2_ARAVE|nr:hypothetical protein AVEN_79830-1 [Araneus ventricosus]
MTTIINISLTELRCLSFNKSDKREALTRCNWLSSVYLLKTEALPHHNVAYKTVEVTKGGGDNFFKRGQGGLSIIPKKNIPPSQPHSLPKILKRRDSNEAGPFDKCHLNCSFD